VQQGVVLLRQDERGEKQLVAYVVASLTSEESTGTALEFKSTLRRFLQERLPEYMVPSFFVALERMPLTPNGKVDRRALPLPQEMQGVIEGTIVAPRSVIEEKLMVLWCDLLGFQRLSILDNFFALGGHSLLATQLISRVRNVFRVEVPLRTLFEAPTMKELAARLEEVLHKEQERQALPLVPVARTQPLPLSFAQQRLWFLDQLYPGNTAYLISSARRLRGKLDSDALERALYEVIQRHESLRTTFALRDDQPVQIIHPLGSFHLPVIDLRGLTEAEREREATRLAQQELGQPCNLERGPLFRSWLLYLNAQDYGLLLTMHHIISDGWSIDLFEREVATFYRAFAAGERVSLQPLTLQYADFATWQQQWLHDEVLEEQIRYWKKQLAGIVPLKLPTDYPQSSARSSHGAAHHFQLTPELSNGLLTLSHQEGVSLFMVLLTGFLILLQRYSGQEDIVVGTDIANRNRTEIEGMIGFFVNQLVLRGDLSGNPTFRDLLRRINGMALEAYAHQDLPFEKLVEATRPDQTFQETPIFQAKLLLREMPHEAQLQALELPDIAVSSLSTSTEVVQNDLIVHCIQTPLGLRGSAMYRTDLFKEATIVRMMHHFTSLLEQILANANAHLATLELLTREEKELQLMQHKERESATFARFKTTKPKPMSLQQEQLVQTGYLQAGMTQPLVIRPAHTELDIVDWAKNNRTFLETELHKHGAILFRDFHVPAAAEFERFALTICPDLFRENGEHVQAKDVGSGNLYTPVFYAPDKKLLWHNENSFNATWPMKILFHCALPAEQGGETPMADSRTVFQRIDPQIREQFLQKGIMYVRNYGEGLGLSWQEVFRTNERAEVERFCRQEEIEFEWKDGDRLCTRQIRPAVIKHPVTGEWVWWNQATHWHTTCLDPAVRESLLTLFSEEDLPRTCYYGDGSRIEDTVIEHICEVYQEVEVSFPWQQGDIFMLDNMLVAHARNPYQGPRKIYVSLGGMTSLHEMKKWRNE
jgi:alpha-ketoglutarate-dependent taurine dioxygenase